MCREGHRVLVLVTCFVAASALGQTPDKAQLSGIVRDESGGVVPGVELRLQGKVTGLQRRTASSATGTFLFPFIPPGRYTLRARFSGFAPLEVNGLRLNANQSLDLPLTLKVAGIDGALTVEAEAQAIETTSSSMRFLVSEEEIEELPVLTDISVVGGDRNVIDSLTAVTPGATFLPRNDGFQNSARVKQVAINGTPPGAIGFSFSDDSHRFTQR